MNSNEAPYSPFLIPSLFQPPPITSPNPIFQFPVLPPSIPPHCQICSFLFSPQLSTSTYSELCVHTSSSPSSSFPQSHRPAISPSSSPSRLLLPHSLPISLSAASSLTFFSTPTPGLPCQEASLVISSSY